MSQVDVKCIDGFMDHPSFTCPTKRKKRSRGHRKNNRKNELDLHMLSIDLRQLLESRGMISIIKCLNNLSKRNLIFSGLFSGLFWIVKNNTALEYSLK